MPGGGGGVEAACSLPRRGGQAAVHIRLELNKHAATPVSRLAACFEAACESEGATLHTFQNDSLQA